MGKKNNFQKIHPDNGVKLGPEHKMARPDLAAAAHARASSNCAGVHDARPNRQRSRHDAKRAAFRDQGY